MFNISVIFSVKSTAIYEIKYKKAKIKLNLLEQFKNTWLLRTNFKVNCSLYST